jgi:hypothetical protein
VLLKTVGEGGLEIGDLPVEFADDRHCGLGRRGECLGQHGRGGEMGGAQRDLDLGGAPAQGCAAVRPA